MANPRQVDASATSSILDSSDCFSLGPDAVHVNSCLLAQQAASTLSRDQEDMLFSVSSSVSSSVSFSVSASVSRLMSLSDPVGQETVTVTATTTRTAQLSSIPSTIPSDCSHEEHKHHSHSHDDDDELSPGTVAGITISSLALVALFWGLVFFTLRYRRQALAAQQSLELFVPRADKKSRELEPNDEKISAPRHSGRCSCWRAELRGDPRSPVEAP
ncbi:hypothetical protein F4780DRAFT_3092 [Xylariomycetidae sp. FL0641]|nr:hypothetical protein F4780DRAFT_3092 [Xylariomycetidae sp. FL0641]